MFSDEKINYTSFLLDKPQETDPEKRRAMMEAVRTALVERGVHGHISCIYYTDGRVRVAVDGVYYNVFDTMTGKFFSGYVGDER